SRTWLIISALRLQIGSGAANSILAKSLEPATELNSAPIVVLEPATPRPVAYRSMVINKGEAPKVLSQLKSEIGEEKLAVLLKLNRLDAPPLCRGATILLPGPIVAVINLPPVPTRFNS